FEVPSEDCPIVAEETVKGELSTRDMVEAFTLKSTLEALKENIESSSEGLTCRNDLIKDLESFLDDLQKAEQIDARCAFLLYRGFRVDMARLDRLGVYV